MNIQKRTLIYFVLFLSTISISAQNVTSFVPTATIPYFFTPQNVGFATPQTADFVRHGNIGINHYNGLLDMTIPLYEYKDNDFEIPIFLTYNSEGFKSSKRPSLVGYNWILNVGGIITRNVNGAPDDVAGNPTKTNNEYMPDGYLVGARKRSSDYTNHQLWNFQMQKTDNSPYVWKDFQSDFARDIFYFNFGRHQGSFIIKGTSALLLSGKDYAVDISDMTSQDYSATNAPKDSKITIVTSDGFIYEFGGNTSYLEYLVPSNSSQGRQKPVFIVSWYLNSITAPNGRIVTFSYTPTEQKNKYAYHMSYSISTHTLIMCSQPGPPVQNVPGLIYDAFGTVEITDKIFVPFLDKITIENTVIDFNREKYNTSFYSTETTSDLYYLNAIKINYDTELVKEIAFSYRTQGRYFFLDELNLNKQHNNKQLYKFDYYLDRPLPDPQTISVDHWGFWSGGYDITEDSKSYLMNIYDRKSVNTSVFNTGLLKSIVYPTGGKTEIEYEYNRYHRYKVKDEEIIHLQNVFSPTSIPTGGARVKKIRDYDPVNGIITNERTFLYRRPNESFESGIIGTLPNYSSFNMTQTPVSSVGGVFPNMYFCSGITTTMTLTISSNTIGTEQNIPEYHIGYSDVIEQFSDGSFIHYHFSSLIDVPDDESVRSFYLIPPIPPGTAVNDRSGLYKVNDMSKYRGRLLTKTTYSSSNEVVEKEIFTYNLAEAKNSFEVTVTSVPAGTVANRIFTVPCRVIQYESIQSNVSNKTQYSYNSKNLLSEKTTTNSDGKKQTTRFIYPFEITSGIMSGISQNMTNRNVISDYVYKISLVNDMVVGAEMRIFDNVGTICAPIFRPAEIRVLRPNNPIAESQLYASQGTASTLGFSGSPPQLENTYRDSREFTLDFSGQLNISRIVFEERHMRDDLIMSSCRYFIQVTRNGWAVFNKEVFITRDGVANSDGTMHRFEYNNGIFIELSPGAYTITIFRQAPPSDEETYIAEVSFSVGARTTDLSPHLPFRSEISYKYDNKGNVIEVKLIQSNIVTAYLWSYAQQYPIAKIEGLSYEQVRSVLGENLINSLARAIRPSDNEIRDIHRRIQTAHPDAFVTTYTHIPLVGISSITDPRGITTYYNYDAFGRLREVYLRENGQKQILQAYDYRYRSQ